jgi:hypothetical protein
MPSLRGILYVTISLRGLSYASSASTSHSGPLGRVLCTSFWFMHLPLILSSCLLSPYYHPPICILPSFFRKVFRHILFLMSKGTSGLQVHVVLQADSPCFHSWGWLIVQLPVLSFINRFSPLDISWLILQGFTPQTISYGKFNNNTFTSSACLSMVILFDN